MESVIHEALNMIRQRSADKQIALQTRLAPGEGATFWFTLPLR